VLLPQFARRCARREPQFVGVCGPPGSRGVVGKPVAALTSRRVQAESPSTRLDHVRALDKVASPIMQSYKRRSIRCEWELPKSRA